VLCVRSATQTFLYIARIKVRALFVCETGAELHPWNWLFFCLHLVFVLPLLWDGSLLRGLCFISAILSRRNSWIHPPLCCGLFPPFRMDICNLSVISQPTPVAFLNRPRWLFQPTPVAISTDPGGWHSPPFSPIVRASRTRMTLRVFLVQVGVSPDVLREATRAAPGTVGR
jgi:hypothetical protein